MYLTPLLESGRMLNGPIRPLRRVDCIRITRMLHDRRAARAAVEPASTGPHV